MKSVPQQAEQIPSQERVRVLERIVTDGYDSPRRSDLCATSARWAGTPA